MHKISFCEVCFLRLQKEPFLRSYSIQLMHYFIARENCEKECTMPEIILVQGYCQVFLMDFVLIICFSVA